MKTLDIFRQLIKCICVVIPSSKQRRKVRLSILKIFGLTDYIRNQKKYNIGEFSYLNEHSTIANPKETTIGKYCSIAQYVNLGLSQHPTETLTTHGFICQSEPMGDRSRIDDAIYATKNNVVNYATEGLLPIHIGNDVWIGFRAIIMDGVNIGDGAIVAAGSIVTRDVEPYTVVAGVPAKSIRKRFSNMPNGEEIRKKLQELKWWDYPPEFVRTLPFADVEKCIELLEENINLRDK